MTNKEKSLLLQDLCARLPYGVQCKYNRILPIGWEVSDTSTDGTLQSIEIETSGSINVKIDGRLHGLSDFKPYLRPMSSITEEEREEWADLFMKPICELEQYIDEKEAQDMAPILYGKSHSVSIDWLNKKMFDYRGLIPMGLSLPATEDMYH